MPIWRRRGIAVALVLGLAGAIFGPAAVAGECSIEEHGETVYERVKAILKNKMERPQGLVLVSYSEIDVELLPGCVFKIDGKFGIHQQNNQLKFKRFHGEFARKNGAPMGFKKLKFSVSN